MYRTDAMAEPMRLRASSSEDVLSFIPYLLGFRPENSLVTLLLRGGLLQLTARIDLPPPGADVELSRVARHFASVAQQHGAHEAVVATFTGNVTWSDTVVRRLEHALGRGGCEVVTALHCDDEQYRVRSAVGWTGPYDFDPRATAGAATAVAAGMSLLPDRAALAASIAPGGADAIGAVTAAAEEADMPEDPADREALMAQVVGRCLDLAGVISDADCAQLALLAADLDVRDVAWLMVRRETATAHRQLWQAVACRVPKVLSAAPVCLAGMAAWVEGDGALAWCCVHRARTEHPGYGMADLLADLLAAAVPPRLWESMAQDLAAG